MKGYFALLLCLLVSVVQGGATTRNLGNKNRKSYGGPKFEQGKTIVETARGLQVENHFIAGALVTRERCQEIREEIRQIIAEVDGGGLRGDDSTETASLLEWCFCSFSGSDEVRIRVQNIVDIRYVEGELLIQTLANPPSWGLNRIDQTDLPLSMGVPFSTTHSGEGVDVYVIDTGINKGHVEFIGRSAYGGDFVLEDDDDDMNGHGTHCAGTVGGTSYGVARGANLIGVKVLSAGGRGSTTGVVQGIEWAVDAATAKGEPAVLSMSLGGGKSSTLENAVKAAAEAGLIVVIAAGNSNVNACGASPAGAGGNAREFLVHSDAVITVGSTTASDSKSSFSNYGSCVDIWAPGSAITSAWKGTSTATNTISGTSMATPHVAGVAAVLLEKHNMNKQAAMEELFNIAVPNRISNLDENSPNLLLQTPFYTGPPTPPTLQPTFPPTFKPQTLCVGTTDETCFDFEVSSFGPAIPEQNIVQGELVVENSELCEERENVDWTDKIVLVPRGTCYFFDKVMNAQLMGAKAVIIHLLDPNEEIFPPNYYFEGETAIVSVMISLDDANVLKSDHQGDLLTLGSLSFLGNTPAPTTPNPTNSPTSRPTNQPTNQPTTIPPTPYPSSAPTTMYPTLSPVEPKIPTARPTVDSEINPTDRPSVEPENVQTPFPSADRRVLIDEM